MRALFGVLMILVLIGCVSGYNLPATTFKGNVDMYGYNLSNLTTPVSDSDAVTKAYADSIAVGGGLPISGGEMEGIIDFGGYVAINSTTPVNDTDLSTKKYVDDSISPLPVDSDLWTKINKTGDIMTGDLTFGTSNISLSGGFISALQSDGVFNIKSFGAYGDDYDDDAPYIQLCYDKAHELYDATGEYQTVYWPNGTYFANTSQTHYDNPGILIENRPGVITVGSGVGSTILRAKDNYRNSTQGCYLFWNEDEYLPGMQIHGMSFEYGNNIVETGEINASAIGAAITSDVIVSNCEFNNVSGYWALMLGSSGANRSLCKGAFVHDIKVHNVGKGISGDQTYDHTSVRFNMDNVVFSDSILSSDSFSSTSAGFEFHGNDSVAYGIQVHNYLNGVLLGADQDSISKASGQIIHNCLFRTSSGIGIWSLPVGSTLSDVSLLENKIFLINNDPTVYHAGITTGIVTGSVKNVSILRNEITDTVHEAFVTSLGAHLARIESLTFADNIIRNCTNGIKVESTEDITNYVIELNNIYDWGYGVVNGQHSSCIYIDVRPSVDSGVCTIANNRLYGDGHPLYGILTYTPNLEYLNIVDNDVIGAATADIVTWFPGSYYGEKTYIRHVSHAFPASSDYHYAINGSTWENLDTGISQRKDGTWKNVTWTLT
jgi:hypothetical protein